tara:strand:+ start:276 stop:704 length:429 start_codon:yes stop_codon:yes gene_type:complete
MKKALSLIMVTVITFVYAGSVTPTIAMRMDNLTDDNQTFANCIGLKVDVGSGVHTGFDSYTNSIGTLSRIYVQKGFAKFGMGTASSSVVAANDSKPYFTIGGIYNVLGNLNMEIEYVLYNDYVDGGGAVVDNVLNLSLVMGF